MMRDGSIIHAVVAWGLYFATTIYGHVALKLAAGDGSRYDLSRSVSAFSSAWGITAFAAWGVSAWAWVLILTRHTLIEAGLVSALRVVFVVVAAWLFLGERCGAREIVGALCVTAGLLVMRR